VRSEPDKLKRFDVRFAIDEEQIGLEMTLAVIVPIAAECVILQSNGKHFIGSQQPDCRIQKFIESRAVLARLYPPEVSFEFLRDLDLPHSALREADRQIRP
jgi:hypothetical protein